MIFPAAHSPWYNRIGWLGVKHQLTYLQLHIFHIEKIHFCLLIQNQSTEPTLCKLTTLRKFATLNLKTIHFLWYCLKFRLVISWWFCEMKTRTEPVILLLFLILSLWQPQFSGWFWRLLGDLFLSAKHWNKGNIIRYKNNTNGKMSQWITKKSRQKPTYCSCG